MANARSHTRTRNNEKRRRLAAAAAKGVVYKRSARKQDRTLHDATEENE